MGYAPRPTIAYFEVGNTHQLNYFDIGTVATTPTWGAISSTRLKIPNARARFAFLDAYFPVVTETSGANNRLTDLHYIQCSRTDITGWNNAIEMNAQTMYVAANATINYGRQLGTENIATVVNACIDNSTAMKFQWINANADHDFIRISNSYLVLRIST